MSPYGYRSTSPAVVQDAPREVFYARDPRAEIGLRAPLANAESIHAHTALVSARLGAANQIRITPLVVPYFILVQAVEARCTLADADALNDIGLYDWTGMKMLSSGSTVYATAGLKMTTLATPVKVYPGQYHAAWTSNQGGAGSGAALAHAANLPVAGMVRRCGTLATGGGTLPTVINLQAIVDTVNANFWLHLIGRGS